MAKWIKALATRPEDLILISEIRVVKRKNPLPKQSSDFHWHTGAHSSHTSCTHGQNK